MSYSTNSTVSTKMLHAAKESLGELINGTAEVVGVFKALQQVAAETGLIDIKCNIAILIGNSLVDHLE